MNYRTRLVVARYLILNPHTNFARMVGAKRFAHPPLGRKDALFAYALRRSMTLYRRSTTLLQRTTAKLVRGYLFLAKPLI